MNYAYFMYTSLCDWTNTHRLNWTDFLSFMSLAISVSIKSREIKGPGYEAITTPPGHYPHCTRPYLLWVSYFISYPKKSELFYLLEQTRISWLCSEVLIHRLDVHVQSM